MNNKFSKNFSEHSNQRFLTETVEKSPYGEMTGVFIIEAMRFYSEMIKETIDPNTENNAIVSPKLWHDIAIYVSEAIQSNFNDQSKG